MPALQYEKDQQYAQQAEGRGRRRTKYDSRDHRKGPHQAVRPEFPLRAHLIGGGGVSSLGLLCIDSSMFANEDEPSVSGAWRIKRGP